jgi:hypothetical protein
VIHFAYLEKCQSNNRNAKADVENIEWGVRLSDGAYLSQVDTTLVNVASQHHLRVVQEEEDNTTNLELDRSYELHTF